MCIIVGAFVVVGAAATATVTVIGIAAYATYRLANALYGYWKSDSEGHSVINAEPSNESEPIPPTSLADDDMAVGDDDPPSLLMKGFMTRIAKGATILLVASTSTALVYSRPKPSSLPGFLVPSQGMRAYGLRSASMLQLPLPAIKSDRIMWKAPLQEDEHVVSYVGWHDKSFSPAYSAVSSTAMVLYKESMLFSSYGSGFVEMDKPEDDVTTLYILSSDHKVVRSMPQYSMPPTMLKLSSSPMPGMSLNCLSLDVKEGEGHGHHQVTGIRVSSPLAPVMCSTTKPPCIEEIKPAAVLTATTIPPTIDMGAAASVVAAAGATMGATPTATTTTTGDGGNPSTTVRDVMFMQAAAPSSLLPPRPVVVVDVGSGIWKAGLNIQSQPDLSFSAIVGRQKYKHVSNQGSSIYVGSFAQSKRGALTLSYPIQHGIVQDWEDLERLWDHTFKDVLRIDPQDHPLLITEPPMMPTSQREEMVEMLFNKFNVPAVYMANEAALTMYATGRQTGCVLNSGHGSTYAVPVFEGYAMAEYTQNLNMGGADLTEFFSTLLRRHQGLLDLFDSSAHREIIRDMKEATCSLALDPYDEWQGQNLSTMPYVLPDGQEIAVGTERYQCPEALFNPALIGKEALGVHEMVHKAITACDRDIQKDLFSSIVLCGGSTLFPNMAPRLMLELFELANAKMAKYIDVLEPQDRANSVWLGGSILASLSTFRNMCITREQFEEVGKSIVRKCY